MSDLFITIIVLVIYFLPSIISYESKNFGQIMALNLLLGWTLIGWVIALIWSLAPKK
jgi:hypothetical protein